ncbi:hypothetical protein HB904_11740 [Listeria booriae]|uniref:Uncharacterized protein n=1 Tax=Listeria booriae TaxID=1552123 RepID=A0A842ACP9_9LIST|nr:hypothetical protein [Listeria booriae]MBC1402622.1 hypothetical protein [Listeria booriae]MBC1616866.1 hypothetical protein [Listeria booriae]
MYVDSDVFFFFSFIIEKVYEDFYPFGVNELDLDQSKHAMLEFKRMTNLSVDDVGETVKINQKDEISLNSKEFDATFFEKLKVLMKEIYIWLRDNLLPGETLTILGI